MSHFGAGGCRPSAERGQVLILWILAVTVILVVGAIVIDVGLWLTERRKAQMAADFAALAAASELGSGFGQVQARGREFAERNGFKHKPGEVAVDVNTPYNGDPGMVEVTIKQGSPMLFAGIFGVGAFEIGARAVGTLGSGEAGPLDLVMIIDRTSTMSGTDLDNAKNAAKEALRVFDPSLQHVALGVIWASDPASPCNWKEPGDWVPVKLSQGNDYRNPDGTLNTSSTLVQTIDCLGISTGPGTNFRDPVAAAADELVNKSPRGASPKKALIFLTDGQANNPSPSPCDSADQQAAAAKNAGIEIFTIGFGVDGMTCGSESSPYGGASVTRLLADMATNSDDQYNCGTPSGRDDENADRDHFFCEAKSEDLAPILERVAEDLTQGYRLYE